MTFNKYLIIILNKNSFFRIFIMLCLENRTFDWNPISLMNLGLSDVLDVA